MYNKLNIHDLRKIARELGVRSPTTLAKKELIEQIEKIKRGNQKPYYTKIGRPTLEQFNNNAEFEQAIQNQVKKFCDFAKMLAEEFNLEK